MLRPELVRILTESDYLSKTWSEGFPAADPRRELRRSEDPRAPEGDTPFDFAPQRIHLHKDHEIFEDGDIHRHLYMQNLSIWETEDKPKLSVSEFGCHISGCNKVFSSVAEYEHHYNALHRHICCSCHLSLPSARLLDIHIQEWHDSLFSILAQRQDMTLSWLRLGKSPCRRAVVKAIRRSHHLLKLHTFSLATGRKAARRIVDHGSSVKAELIRYIQVSSDEEEVDWLDFWKRRARLHLVAMRVLAVPATSAPVEREAGDPWTNGGGYSELGEFGEDFWNGGVERRAEVYKQDPCICHWVVKVFQDVVQSHVDCIIY
ncbi:zinc finger protein 511 [Lampris incognitus]|uniref:zinc finger protein 511 n=1 Tax=Lampris incognitus TaxID=2546036 RepID=UPI0024B632F2|nr:zinc finger protein 511 [Lampris incognitus]